MGRSRQDGEKDIVSYATAHYAGGGGSLGPRFSEWLATFTDEEVEMYSARPYLLVEKTPRSGELVGYCDHMKEQDAGRYATRVIPPAEVDGRKAHYAEICSDCRAYVEEAVRAPAYTTYDPKRHLPEDVIKEREFEIRRSMWEAIAKRVTRVKIQS